MDSTGTTSATQEINLSALMRVLNNSKDVRCIAMDYEYLKVIQSPFFLEDTIIISKKLADRLVKAGLIQFKEPTND